MIKKLTILTLFSLLIAVLFSPTIWAAESPKKLSDVQRITIDELKTLQQKEAVVVIDTRAPGQWLRAQDKVPGALRLQSHSDLDQFKQQVPLDHAIVTYCTWPSEGTSASLALTLFENGYTRVWPLLGGYGAWQKSGLPVESK